MLNVNHRIASLSISSMLHVSLAVALSLNGVSQPAGSNSNMVVAPAATQIDETEVGAVADLGPALPAIEVVASAGAFTPPVAIAPIQTFTPAVKLFTPPAPAAPLTALAGAFDTTPSAPAKTAQQRMPAHVVLRPVYKPASLALPASATMHTPPGSAAMRTQFEPAGNPYISTAPAHTTQIPRRGARHLAISHGGQEVALLEP